MSRIIDILGTWATQFQIGIGGTGSRRLRFRNGFSGDLEWTPTANRTLTLPDESGTIAVVPTRKVGLVYAYTGADPANWGYFDDYDGKWVFLTLDGFRTIGNTSSGADIGETWTQKLFEHFWTQYNNIRCPVLNHSGSPVTRGSSATADFNAARRIMLPDYRGRVVAGAGTGSGLSARLKSTTVGAETHTLSESELAPHPHTYDRLKYVGTGGNVNISAGTAWNHANENTGTGGAGHAHNNMQPTVFEHLIISAGAR